MKRMHRGMTLLETIISLGLVSIFSLIIFPTLKISNELNREVDKKSLVGRESVRILNIIERSISKSIAFSEEYSGKEYIKDGIGIIEERRILISSINESVLKKSSKEGNTLFLEYPRSNGVRIENSILVFQFVDENLIIVQGRVKDKKIVIEFSDTLYEGVDGEFRRVERGVVIEYEILGKNSDIKEKIKGYENINISY